VLAIEVNIQRCCMAPTLHIIHSPYYYYYSIFIATGRDEQYHRTKIRPLLMPVVLCGLDIFRTVPTME
jgi:hypothetical protein